MSGKKKEAHVYGPPRKRFAVEWKTFALTFVFILIADSIGQVKVPVGKGIFILFPIFYTIILGVLSGPQMLKIVNGKQAKAASKLVVVGICPFIVKLGITAGANIGTILQSDPMLLFHGFGNLLSPLLTLPAATLLGTKWEAIGVCHSINREYHMALVGNIYGPDPAKAKDSLSIYIVGEMVGAIYFGLMISVIGMASWLHSQALGLASDVGAGIMMASSNASLCVIYPSWIETISAMASVEETIVRITGTYITMLIATPMTDKLYRILEPKLGRFALKSRGIREGAV